MKFLKKMLARFGIARELLDYFWKNKLWWLIPLLVVIVVFSAFIILTHMSPLAPFIYVLF